jgi:hypothetical protein
MRTEQEVKTRVRELVSQELSFRLKEASKRLPKYCVNYYAHTLDSRKTVDGVKNPMYNRINPSDREGVTPTLGLCRLGSLEPEYWGGTICEDPIDAIRCPNFQPISTKGSIIAELERDLKDPDWIKYHIPELYSLIWVLGSESELKVSWWKKVLVFFRVIKVEPLRVLFDPSVLR